MMRARFRRTIILGCAVLGLFIIFCLISELPANDDAEVEGEQKHPNDDNIPEEDIQQMIKEAEADNAARLQKVEEVCRLHNLGLYRQSAEPPKIKHPPTPQYSVFYIDRVHNLSWCPLYKAASTTWLYNLCLLGGYTEDFLANTKEQLSVIARKIFPEKEYSEAEEAFHSTLKLLVVRHPFERLLSAYRDKLENILVGREHGTFHYYKKYGRRIVAKYRPGGNNTKTESLLRPDQYLWDPNKSKPAGIEPTFREFVSYLLDTDLVNYADDHWIPYYLFCTPCLLKYDVIGKVETLLRDQVYVIYSANLQKSIRPRWLHRTKQHSLISKRYFSQLSSAQVQQLYVKYQLDFELFDYKVDDYLKFASSA